MTEAKRQREYEPHIWGVCGCGKRGYELALAIPPAYTEHIGLHLLEDVPQVAR